jgi:hypothetical protein
MNPYPAGEKCFLFIESCLNEWQSRKDLCIILQCNYRTVRRIINRFKDMVMTNEISKFYYLEDELYTGKPGLCEKIIMIKEKI